MKANDPVSVNNISSWPSKLEAHNAKVFKREHT